MRADSGTFAAFNEAASKSARFVVAHIFDVESVYVTSHADIPSVPGVVIENVLREPSAISQRIVPDEGRSEIGSFTYSIIDKDSAFTNEARDKLLSDSKSFRGKLVEYYVGYDGLAFSQFQLFQTQVIKDVSYADGVYQFSCADITREQREEIFDPKKTTLRDSVDEDDTTIPVGSAAGFVTVFHGPSYSDGPSSTVGYFKLEDEIIRYTGTTVDTFTGCTRGVLNTRAAAHTVDPASDTERRPKIEEVIYLELPAPKLAYAILTGVLHDDAATLPGHWHCGIDTDLVRLSDFTGIGPDLWDTSLDTNGFVVRFAALTKINAKKFLEAELYQLLGCYSPIYSDGTIGLQRMNPVLADAAYVVELNESNVIDVGELNYGFSRLHNRLRIDWNWDGQDFTRTKLFFDAQSIAIHGEGPLKTLKFKGLHGSRHTESIIRTRMDAFRDRYTSPPETIPVTVMPSLNRLEVGDVVRLKLAKVRDFAGNELSINRSFEIQQKSQADAKGDVQLSLFGSTAPASTEAPNDTGGGDALPDAFYTAEGTDLSTVCTIVPVGGVGVIQPGTYNLTGHADVNNSAAIYYYAGDLELANGATLTINDNVQVRARGFFTVNGVIDGVGRGQAGQADAAGWQVTQAGIGGFIGNSRGMDGALLSIRSLKSSYVKTQPAAFTPGRHSTFPFLEIQVSGNSLLGIPSDMRGTSGGAGGKLGLATPGGDFSTGTVTALGGPGADSGAGLCIVSRGLAFGASGTINLSGDDAAATSEVIPAFGIGGSGYPGAGGAGSPGAMLILLDGSSLSLPDVGGKFVAACGTVPINGVPLPVKEGILGLGGDLAWGPPYAGYVDEALISDLDLSNVAYRIQYIPAVETPQEDQEVLPPPINGIGVTGVDLANVITLTLPDVSLFDTVELYASIDNNRANAVLISDSKSSIVRHQLAAGQQRFYWARTKRGALVSDWFPSSPTGGVTGTSIATFIARGNCEVAGQIARKVGGASAWDSDVYSLETYRDGCCVTFKPDQNTANLMVGLNSDPTTDQNFASLDFAFHLLSDANLKIRESGSDIGTFGVYTANTILSIKHDGRRVTYYKNGAAVREVVVGSQAFALDSSFFTPGGQISRLSFGPTNQVTPVPWIARGNCIAGVSTAKKEGGVAAWDSDVYSVESYTACHVVFKPSQANLAVMVGLNIDPLTDQSFSSLDFAFNCAGDGFIDIWESNVQQVSNLAAYTTSTELAITYDGANVRYLVDRVVVRTVPIASQRFHADASFFNAGAAVNSLRFGPGTSLEAVGTVGLEDEAATEVYTLVELGPITPIGIGTHTVASMFFTASADGEVVGTISFDAGLNSGFVQGAARVYEDGILVEGSSGAIVSLDEETHVARIIGSVSAGSSVELRLSSKQSGTPPPNPSAQYSNIEFEAEFIKK